MISVTLHIKPKQGRLPGILLPKMCGMSPIVLFANQIGMVCAPQLVILIMMGRQIIPESMHFGEKLLLYGIKVQSTPHIQFHIYQSIPGFPTHGLI